MPTFTQVTCQYNVNHISGPAAQLTNAVAGVPLDPATLRILGVTASSDATVLVGNQVQRTIVMSFAQPPTILTIPNPQPKAFHGYLVSSFQTDAPSDAGVQQVTLTYDNGGPPLTIAVSMTGTTPVYLGDTTFIKNVTSLTNTVLGPLGSNWGQISLLNDQKRLVAYEPEGFYTSFPDGSDQAAPFNEWMRYAIEKAIGYEVIALAPVLA